MGGTSQLTAERKAAGVYFTTFYFKYAYRQKALDKKTGKQCNFFGRGQIDKNIKIHDRFFVLLLAGGKIVEQVLKQTLCSQRRTEATEKCNCKKRT